MRIKAFWQRVRSHLKEKNVTHAVVAKACGISLDYLTYGREEDIIAKIGDVLISLEKANEKHKAIMQNNT